MVHLFDHESYDFKDAWKNYGGKKTRQLVSLSRDNL